MKMMKKLIKIFYKSPIIASLAVNLTVPFILGVIFVGDYEFYELFVNVSLIGFFLFYPFSLTILNCFFLLKCKQTQIQIRAGRKIEYTTIVLGILFSTFYFFNGFANIKIADWNKQLYNSEMHTPVATWTFPTIAWISVIAICGYLILRMFPLKKLPPLLAVISISAMYLGTALCITWIVQLFCDSLVILILCLFPFNCVLIALKVVKEVVVQWQLEQSDLDQREQQTGNVKLKKVYNLLRKSTNWIWIGFLFMLPFLGILIMILKIFGQVPDSIIQAWTQTGDWNLSQKVPPQNIYIDEHYLCTVAAGGHRRIVKPMRFGKRNGHKVIVNRQLCVANAFEQILQEKLPKAHKLIRHIYDTFGYPIAKHIHSPYIADFIYIMMKPAEWLFLVAIYLCDVKPENRIAIQYPHRPLNGNEVYNEKNKKLY